MANIFIFRRDLRIVDNLALYQTSRLGDVIPCFIFDPVQLDRNNSYFSQKALDFMIDCLEELRSIIPLQIFYGNPIQVVQDLIKHNNINTLSFNADFSPYSKTRDTGILDLCKYHGIDTIVNPSDLVLESEMIPVSKVFGVYYKSAHTIQKLAPVVKRFSGKELKSSYSYTWLDALKLRDRNDTSSLETFLGGRRAALRQIKKIKQYTIARDRADMNTSRMSAYLKFGCISIRELWYIIKNPLYRKQLLWRSFYFLTGAARTGYGHIEKRFDNLPWSKNETIAKQMWTGYTGYPIIDAGVRELLQTGWMHNRARLAVANFSVKILHLNPFCNGTYMDAWCGQVQFSRNLVDCCWALNYGNWMWILGPYDSGGYRYGMAGTFGGRTFKDALVPKKIDPDLVYIKRWVPELESVSDRDIVHWNDPVVRKRYPDIVYEPIVDFDKQLKKWYKMTTK